MNFDPYFFAILIIIIVCFIFELYLDIKNFKTFKQPLPDELSDIFDSSKYLKNQEYNLSKAKFGFVSSSFSFLFLLALLTFDAFALLNNFVNLLTPDLTLRSILFFGILYFVYDIITTPLSIYHTFVIESKFGFNRTTKKVFILDKLKSWGLTIIIGGILLFLISKFYLNTGIWFVPLVFILISSFSLFMIFFYTSLIVPMFNKLTPLPAGTLREDIENLSKKLNFSIADISVMDSSKRSAKSNAFFSGFGKKKKIVLFDTLIEKHSNEELVAILAHEIGHYKKKHIQLGYLFSVFQTAVVLTLLYLFLQFSEFQLALGVNNTSLHIGLVVFGIFFTPFSLLTNILTSFFSRKNEFQADAYAALNYSSNHLQAALKKLSSDNLSHLTPHKLYVKVYYSHPPIIERLRELKKIPN